MAKACLHSNQIVRQWEQQKHPSHQRRSRHATSQRKCQPHQPSEAEKRIVHSASVLAHRMILQRMRHVVPKEEETVDRPLCNLLRVLTNPINGLLLPHRGIRELAHAYLDLELRITLPHWQRWTPRVSIVRRHRRFVQLRAEV